jgi:hypothetical protein
LEEFIHKKTSAFKEGTEKVILRFICE